MRYKSDDNTKEGEPISKEGDPVEQLPEKIQEIIMNTTHDLTIYLGRRTEFFKKQAESLGSDSMDYSTCALIERLAFYETMINSLITVTKGLEERFGGVEGSQSN